MIVLRSARHGGRWDRLTPTYRGQIIVRRFLNVFVWVALILGVYSVLVLSADSAATDLASAKSPGCVNHPRGCQACGGSQAPLPFEIDGDNVRFVAPDARSTAR
jgi:hypothetical protein